MIASKGPAMIETAEETITTCQRCGAPIEQKPGRGHRPRLYCDDRGKCRQRAHRARKQVQAQDTANVTPNVTNGDHQQRIAELERDLARYRKIVDLGDRQKMIAQFMLTGEEIGYKALLSVDVRSGPHAWYNFTQTADDELLARGVAAARHAWKQLADLQTTREVEQLHKIIADLKLERNALRQEVDECNRQQS